MHIDENPEEEDDHHPGEFVSRIVDHQIIQPSEQSHSERTDPIRNIFRRE
jgi:hypothetical protein